MSNALLVTDGQIVTGFDNYATETWCTGTHGGFQACVSVVPIDKSVKLTITIKTPVGSYSKSFVFSKDICFEFNPVKIAGIKVCISDFKLEDKQICFSFGGTLCVGIGPFKKCLPQFKKQFCVPLPGHDLNTLLEKSTDDQALINLLLFQLALDGTESHASCNCK